MTPVSRSMKAYFAAVGALAVWVGYWGLFRPLQVATAIPWTVPPLHARFLGSMYLSGATFMVGCILAKRWCQVRVVVPMIAIWTGLLFIVSLLHWGEFDGSLTQTKVWFGAYLIYALIAIMFSVRHRGSGAADPDHTANLSRWLARYLTAQGAVLFAVGGALLLAPGVMVSAWPWKITPLLAHLYAAPFLSYAVGSLLLSRERAWPHVRVGIAGILAFAVGVLASSVLHRSLFSGADPADWLWFGALALALTALGYATTPRGHAGVSS